MLSLKWLPLLREVLAREGQLRWRVEGRSMVPTLLPGSEVEVVPLCGLPRLGELVIVVQDDELVVHRLVERRRAYWITQGDGRATPDRAMGLESFVGRVVRASYGGRTCWPSRFEKMVVFCWLLRYHLLRIARWRGRRRGQR